MPSRVLETILTGRNLLSPVLTTAAADVTAFDAKVAASQEKAAASAETSAKAQTGAAERVQAANARTAATSSEAAAKVTAANTRVAASSSESSAKVVSANTRAAESSRLFADASESSAARAGVAWGTLATKALPIAAAASVVVFGKMAGNFQSAMTRLVTTAGESSKNVAMVGQGFLDMAGQVGIGATELAQGAYTAESAGYHGADALKVMRAAAEGAKQENADLGKVTDAVSTILHDYHLQASDAGKVTSQLVTAVSHGKTSFDELTGSLHSVTPLASKLGISLADVTGTLAAMTASGESADQATQNMANTLSHLANPTSTMTSELAQLGISASDLATSLSTRGLAGTLQMVEEAIVHHVDPATQRVLLPALNKSKTAAQDLQIMIGQMPPSLAKMSRGLLDGSVSVAEYTKAAKALGGQQAPMALQFLSLEKSSGGFNNVLKGGGPAAQVFTAAMAKSFGTVAALNVALQTTGENTKSTNDGIRDIGAATAQADGNIKGWAEVQGNLNQKLAQAGAAAKTLGIEAGQHLLPILTSVVGWMGDTGIPAIGRLGSGIGSLVHDFQQLPGPVKVVAEVLGGLALANAVGIFSRIGREVTFARGLMMSFATMTRASMGAVSASYNEASAAAARLATIQGETTLMSMRSSIAGLGAAAATAASGGLSAMRTGVSGLVSMLGGPWVLAAAAATAGIIALVKSSEAHKAAVEAETASLLKLMKLEGLGGAEGKKAADQLDEKRKHIADLQKQIDEATQAAVGGGKQLDLYGGSQQAAGDKVAELRSELARAKAEMEKYRASLTPVEAAQVAVTKAENNWKDAIKHNPANSGVVVAAAGELRRARAQLTLATIGATNAEKTQLQVMQDEANLALASVDSSLAAQQAQIGLSQAVAQYAKDAKDGQHSAADLKDEQLSLAQSAISAAEAAGKAAADQASANGVTDTGTISQIAMLKSLKNSAAQMVGPGKDAILAQIKILEKATLANANVATQVDKMGLTVVRTWDANTKEVKGATDSQIADLQALGDKVDKLPNGNIIVTTDTGPAKAQLDHLIAIYKNTTLTVAGNYHVAGLNGGPGGTQTKATGGPIVGPGTGTSDTAGLYALSNGEHVWTAAETAAAGGHTGVEALRRRVLAQGRGLAAGGPVGHFNMYDTMPAQLSAQAVREAEALIKKLAAAQSFAPGAPSSVSANAEMARRMVSTIGWTGGEWNALYALGMRESGWRNTAQNPTSTAYGIPQFLNSTWATVGMSKTSDPGSQIIGMERYIQQRYGRPSAAWAHEQKFGWYEQGTPYVPSDGLAYLHRGERVVPAAQNFTPTSAPGYSTPPGWSGAGGGQVVVVEKRTQITVDASNKDTRAMAAAISRQQRQDEWLSG